MASGNTLLVLTPMGDNPPATIGAQIDFIIGTSTPVEWFPVLAFDTSAVEYADWHGLIMPAHYGGGGLTCTLVSSATTTTGGIVFAAALRRFQDDAEDADTTAQTYDYNTVTIGTLASAIGEQTYDDITFTNGADMDSVAAGEMFTLRVRRDTGNGSDTATGDAFLWTIHIKET